MTTDWAVTAVSFWGSFELCYSRRRQMLLLGYQVICMMLIMTLLGIINYKFKLVGVFIRFLSLWQHTWDTSTFKEGRFISLKLQSMITWFYCFGGIVKQKCQNEKLCWSEGKEKDRKGPGSPHLLHGKNQGSNVSPWGPASWRMHDHSTALWSKDEAFSIHTLGGCYHTSAYTDPAATREYVFAKN